MQVLVTIHRPEGYDASVESTEMAREIDAVNDEMVAAGVRVFVGGLRDPDAARSIRNGQVQSGPLNAGEFIGGLWVLDVANMEEAIKWGEKAARACRAAVEVRPFW